MKSVLQTIRRTTRKSGNDRRLEAVIFLLVFLVTFFLVPAHSHADGRRHSDCTTCVLLSQPVFFVGVFALVMVWVVCRDPALLAIISLTLRCTTDVRTRAPPFAA
jgi:hypothetical protein